MDGQDDRFSGPQATPGADAGFGFFGGPSTPAAPTYPPAGPAFGTPAPAGAPEFGAPASGTAYGAPMYAPPPMETPQGSRKKIAAIILASLLGLGVLGFGWNVWQLHRDIGVPTTLGGLPQLTGSAADQLTATASPSLKSEAKGKKMAFAVYATPGNASSMYVLAAVRGRLKSVDDDLNSGGTGARVQVGHNTCAPFSGGVVCERTSAHLTEAIVAQGATLTTTQVSALLDQAWAKA